MATPIGMLTRRNVPLSIASAIVLAGTGLLLRQWAIARPLWLDEEMIAINLRDRTLADLAGPLWLGQSAPAGWLALQRLVVVSLGSSELALRAVPVAFGIGTLIAALWVGVRWLSPVAALVLAWLCSFGLWLSFHSLELKPYSADAFWALLLPGLLAWVLDRNAEGGAPSVWRERLWWMVAAAALWLANGVILVVPGCACVLLAVQFRRGGARRAVRSGCYAALWLTSFALYYFLSARHALSSPYLRDYWAFALPPASAGIVGTLRWLAAQLEPLAIKPGGVSHWAIFWIAATAGLILARGRARVLGLAFASVPVSAFIFAAVRVVPLYERLSLWVVPALYVGVALCLDAVPRVGLQARGRRARLAGLAVTAASAAVVGSICADVAAKGLPELFGLRLDTNHELDDRAGVRWLTAQLGPGDAIVTTQLALPAIWWYGNIVPSDATIPIVEVGHAPSGRACEPEALANAIRPYRRLLVYLGFRFDDVPAGFDDLLFDELGPRGTLTAYRLFAETGRGAIFDLSQPPREWSRAPTRPRSAADVQPVKPAGCVTARPARAW